MEKLNKRMIENAQKIAYMASVYPEKKMTEQDIRTGEDHGLAGLFQTSPIEFNAAAWAAQDLGYLDVGKDNTITIKDLPEEWNFGELVEHLMTELPYCVGKINANEADIEDEYLGSMWTAGFPAQDVAIAIKRLIETKQLASYEVKNETHIKPNREERRKGAEEKTIVDVYTFYTLPENADKRWGEKQFEDPEKLQKPEA